MQEVIDNFILAPLTGKELVEKVKKLSNLSREEKAKKCGYSRTDKNGKERVNMIGFLNALLEAEEIKLDVLNPEKKQVGKFPEFKAVVQKNGNLLIGSAYTKRLGLNPKDIVEIKLGRKHIDLRIVKVEGSG